MIHKTFSAKAETKIAERHRQYIISSAKLSRGNPRYSREGKWLMVRGLALSILLLSNLTPAHAERARVADDLSAFMHSVTASIGSNEPDKCQLQISYPPKKPTTKIVFHEQPGHYMGAWASTSDRKLFEQQVEVVIDGVSAFSINIGGKIPGRDIAGGVRLAPEKAGREIIDDFLAVAEIASSLKLVAGDREIDLPVFGLKQTVLLYRLCRIRDTKL